MNFIEGFKLQFLSSALVLVKYLLLLGVGLIFGAVLSHVEIVSAFLMAKFGVDTYSFSVLLFVLSSALSNIMGKK
jgi:hypothetical protein